MKRTKWMAGIISLSLVLGLTACNLPGRNSTKASAEAAAETNIESENKQSKDNIIAWGEVGYTDSEEINIDFPSTVESVAVKEGQAVKRGELLITLNMNEYKQNVQKLEKQVALNKVAIKDVTQDAGAMAAEIAQLKEDIGKKAKAYQNGTKAELQILQNSLTRTSKELTDARKDYDRQKQLFEVGAVTQKTLDDYLDIIDKKERAKIDTENNIKKTKELLQDEIDALQTTLEYKEVQLVKMNTSNRVNVDKQDIAIGVSQLDLNMMQTKLAKSYLKDNQIISNIENGIVKNINVIKGSTLGKQNMPQKIMEIIDADTIVVRAEVPEEFIRYVHEGDKAQIIPKTDESKKIAGVVTQISNIAIEKDGERIVKVEVKPEDTEDILKAGCSADVIFGAN